MPRSASQAPPRARFRFRTPPRGLAALLAVVVVVGLIWALLVPPWQSPDEVAHFAYVQSLAESFQLPGAKGRPQVSSDQSAADSAVGARRGAFYPQSVPPDWSRSDYAAYLALVHSRAAPPRTDGSGPNPASSNPPLYYLYGAVGYLIDHGGTAFGRLYATRIWGVLLLLATTVAAWLLAGEAFGRRRVPQLACAAVAGLLPMSAFISTSVNPDALMITLWTLALWLGARVINHGARGHDAVALGAVTSAAILTKATSYALVVPVIIVLVLGWRIEPPAERRRALRRIAGAGLALVVPVLAWLALAHALGRPAINTISSGAGAHPFSVTQFLSYIWQFYVPRLPFMTPFGHPAQLPVYGLWLQQGAGVFGWLDVAMPDWVYPVAGALGAGITIATVGLLTRLRGIRPLALLAFFALTLVALLGLLHITDYRSIIAGPGPILQGRYLLPVVGLLGLAVGLIISRVPPRVRPTACGLVLTALLATQTISVTTILHAYYL